MFKKISALFLAMLMAMSLMACDQKLEEAPDDSDDAQTEESVSGEGLNGPVNLTLAAQEVGTGAYSVAAAIQSAMMKGLPEGSTIDLTTNSPGGVGAPVLIQNEECDLIVSNAGPSQWSYTMTPDEYDFGGCTDITTLGGGLGHTFTIVMFTQKFVDETGYTSLEEVIADRYPAERVIEACGSSVEDFLSFATWEKTGTDAIKSGLQDDLYDMTIDHIDAGQATTTEICLTHDMYFVQLGDEALANMQTMGYAPIVMEAGTWNGQDTDINSMGSQQNVLVPASMDEELAYALTKAMCENKDEMAQAVASLGYFDPQTAGSAEMCGAPLHPGAIRYYEENGYPYDA